MSHHVIAAVRSPRIGGKLRVLHEQTFAGRYQADQWIAARRAMWCSMLEPPESHVLIIILNGRMVPRCLYEQPADWMQKPEKFTGSHLTEALKAFRLDDRTRPPAGADVVTLETQDMTDRAELADVKGAA